MRSAAGVMVFGCWLVWQTGSACAETCIDASQNNAAFSSTYLAGQAPCQPQPKRAVEPVKQQAHRAQRETIKPAPVVSVDEKPHIVPTEHGTLIKSGDTSVCISGSVSAGVSAGHGTFSQRLPPTSSPGCY